MASPVTPSRPSPAGPALEPDGSADWPVQATDTIVRVVDTVRDKTTGPALNASRWLIYGLVLTILALPLAVLGIVGLFRLIEGGLLWVHDRADWAGALHDPIGFVYLVLGLVLTIAGLVCWRKGRAPAAPAPA